jgi:hypothetical protein
MENVPAARRSPPDPTARRSGVLSDIRRFLLSSPAEPTRVNLSQPGARRAYNIQVLRRLGVNVADHEVLNIHRIGIEAPPETVWEAVVHWSPEAGYWPAGIARGVWTGEEHEHGEIRLFGLGFLPLFRLDLIRRQDVPPPGDPDNARYALFRCSGGYPMGVLFMVSFDFFGRKRWLGTRAVRPVWEPIHDRVTSHVLNRFKAHCLRGGADPAL